MKPKSQIFKATIATILLCLFGLILIHIGHIPYETKDVRNGTFLEKLVRLKPSEIGDTLSGIFGSLAFAATAIAVMMQSRQLEAQRTELKYTRNEYEKNRIATEKMALASEQQFKEMRTARSERELDRENHETSEALAELFAGLVIYTKAVSHNLEFLLYPEGPKKENEWFYSSTNELDFFHFSDDFLLFLCEELAATPRSQLDERLASMITAKDRCISLKRTFNRIDELQPKMTRAAEIRTEIRDLDKLRSAVEKLEFEVSRKFDTL